jgi:hypothetical protein
MFTLTSLSDADDVSVFVYPPVLEDEEMPLRLHPGSYEVDGIALRKLKDVFVVKGKEVCDKGFLGTGIDEDCTKIPDLKFGEVSTEPVIDSDGDGVLDQALESLPSEDGTVGFFPAGGWNKNETDPMVITSQQLQSGTILLPVVYLPAEEIQGIDDLAVLNEVSKFSASLHVQ